jgi:hypothetical protein
MRMNLSNSRGKIAKFLGLLVVAIAYISWMLFQHTLTHHARLDGSIGVLGGLYVCSHPAASFIDLLFFSRHTAENHLPASGWIAWISLNLAVFFLGCVMITVGVTLFT